MIISQNLEKAKNEIKNSIRENKKPIIVKAQNLEFNRRILEYGKFDILLSIEQSFDVKKDKLKQIDSGLNHVLAKIAAKNKVAIGIDLEQIRNKKEKHFLIEKIIQNIKICRKAKCKIKILNCKDKIDALDLLLSLGASTQQAHDAFT